MKTRTALLLLLLLTVCLGAAAGEEDAEVLPFYPYTWTGSSVVRSYDSDTLKYTVEVAKYLKTRIYVTKVWMVSPGEQIKKATSPWHEHLELCETMAKTVDGAALVINGSGYVSPKFPWIPEDYPGESEDYYFTPLGSLTVTDGVLFRKLDGVAYYGLTLEADGLHMYVGADNDEVLSAQPTQTWSFYTRCPLIADHASILDRDWDFANNKAIRTIIAKMDANNYLILTVTSIHGLTLPECTDFLLEAFDPEWAYDLDGGPSTALLCRNYGKKTFKAVYGGTDKDADIMAFTELK